MFYTIEIAIKDDKIANIRYPKNALYPIDWTTEPLWFREKIKSNLIDAIAFIDMQPIFLAHEWETNARKFTNVLI